MGPALRVLLLSPLRTLDPPNGDVTYTEQLLAEPPSDVVYTRYDDALSDGRIVELARRSSTGSGRRNFAPLAVLGREALVNRLRRRGLLFREPFRHFAVDPAAFDLVHSHVFAVRLYSERRVPLVIGNSIEIDALYRDGFGNSGLSTAARREADRWLARATGVTHATYEHRGADRVVCFSDDLRSRFVARAAAAASRYVVVPPSVSPLPPRPEPAGFTIGFIGDWDAKGGDIVLAAHRRLRTEGVDARLLIIGSEPRIGASEAADLHVEWLPRQRRSVLLDDLIPQMSVFAYPTRFDGLPLTVLEVMSAGVPVVVSDYRALPEVVDQGAAGVITPMNNPPAALASALRALLDGARRAEIGRAGRRRVLERYVSARTAPALSRAYREAVQSASRGHAVRPGFTG